jgi:hypothetical protein
MYTEKVVGKSGAKVFAVLGWKSGMIKIYYATLPAKVMKQLEGGSSFNWHCCEFFFKLSHI